MCQRQSQYVWPVYAIWGLLIWARCAMPAGATDPAPQPAKVDFERHVAPILTRHCLECHHGADPAGGLDLSTWERAVQGGDSGAAAIVPRQLEASYLVARIRDGEMPPAKAAPLAEPDAATLEAWITAGADWPGGRALSLFENSTAFRAGADWWSFQPIRRPTPPSTRDRTWARGPLDAFVLAALEARGLEPATETDRASYLRRVKFDLVGLPPTPEEIVAFVSDGRPDAYERLVDGLLASPHYGERWARHWLDVVRFAESQGYETNVARPNAWPYRDYVIDALNRDIPFRQMIVEQLAGDQRGADAATGFLVGGAHDIVQSPEPELTAQQRLNDLDDMVTTTAAAFLGLTLACAKCHDHKFDPFSQHDYYALQAMFAGVQHGERPLRRDDEPDRQQQRALWQAELAQQESALAMLLAEHEPLARVGGEPAALPSRQTPREPGAERGANRPPVHARYNQDRFAPVPARFVRFTVLATNNLEPCIDELEIYSPRNPQHNLALATLGVRATASSTYAAGASDIHRLEHIHDGRVGNSRSWISAEAGAGWIQLELPQESVIERVVWARDREGKFRDRLATEYRIEVATVEGQWETVATSDDRAPFDAGLGEPPALDERSLPPAAIQAYRELREAMDRLRRSIAQSAPQMAYTGTFSQPGPTYRLHRGEPLQRREQVGPATPASLSPRIELTADAPEAARRLALAQWLGDDRHPLTARVLVNRLWQHHFGRGLTPNPNDLGFHGGQPSHPELLDWLASELIAGGWRLKSLHRQIVLSATYRQSSRPSDAALAVDAESVYLWRYPPRRLEAEAIRDAILAVSGQLNRQMGGPGYDPFEPNDNYVKVYIPRRSFGPNEWRRMIYQNKPRMRQDSVFGEFDCPDASHSIARRNVSTTALQALNLLNGPFVVEQARAFAERLESEYPRGPEPAATAAARIDRAFWLAFGRAPAEDERAAAEQLVAGAGLPALCRAMYNANEFLYLP